MRQFARFLVRAAILAAILPGSGSAGWWELDENMPYDSVWGVHLADHDHRFAVGTNTDGSRGTIYWRDPIIMWEYAPLPTAYEKYNYQGVWAVESSVPNTFIGWAVGWKIPESPNDPQRYKGIVLKFEWNATTWEWTWTDQTGNVSWPSTEAPINCTPFLDVSFADANHGYICAGNGYVLTTTNGGQNPGDWIARKMIYDTQYSSTFLTQWFWGVWADPEDPNKAWVCADGQGFLANTTNGGASWNYVRPPREAPDGFQRRYTGIYDIGEYLGWHRCSDIWCKDFDHPLVPLCFAHVGLKLPNGEWRAEKPVDLYEDYQWFFGCGSHADAIVGERAWVCGVDCLICQYHWWGTAGTWHPEFNVPGGGYHCYDVDCVRHPDLNHIWGNAVSGGYGVIFRRLGSGLGSWEPEGAPGPPPTDEPGQVLGLTAQYIALPIGAVRLDWNPRPADERVGGYWVCPVDDPGEDPRVLCHSAPVTRTIFLIGWPEHVSSSFAVCAMDRDGDFGQWSAWCRINTDAFANPTILEATASCNAHRLLRDASGRLHTAYATSPAGSSGQDLHVYYRYSADDGASWSQEEGVGGGEYPSMGLETTANPNACWRRNTSGESIVYFSRRLGGDAGWTTPYELLHGYNASTVYSVPAHRVDNADVAHIVVEKTSVTGTICSWMLLYGRFPVADPGSAQWETIDAETPYYYPWSSNQASPSISLDSDGNPYVCWSRGGEIYAATKLGASWPTMNVSESPANDSKDCSIELQVGTAHFVWAEEMRPGAGDYDILHRAYRYFPPPQDWLTTAPENISNSPAASEAPVFCANCVTWHEETGDWTEVYFSAKGDPLWTAPQNISNCDWADSKFPQMVYVGATPPKAPHVKVIWSEGREPLCMIQAKSIEASGSGGGGGQSADDLALLKAFSLGQNFPNPLTSVTTIEYAVAKPCQVSVGVYDVTGRLIETLADGRHQPGLCSTTWNGRDSSGNKVPSGVYFYRLSATRQGGSASGGRAGDFTATKQLVVLR